MNINGDTLLSFRETKTFLCCGSTKLYELLQDGILRGRKINRRWRIAESDLQRYLKQQTDNRRRII